jgi:hypothetical protein
MKIPVEVRLLSKLSFQQGCIEFQGSTDKDGYGQIGGPSPHTGKQTMLKAHRVAYELFVGPIPPGLTIDHLCRNTKCTNPVHLEVVTDDENRRRSPAQAAATRERAAQQRSATHCKNGHLRTPENFYYWKHKRYCRLCQKAGKK